MRWTYSAIASAANTPDRRQTLCDHCAVCQTVSGQCRRQHEQCGLPPTNQIVDYYGSTTTRARRTSMPRSAGGPMRSSSTTRTWSRAPTMTWTPSRATRSRCRPMTVKIDMVSNRWRPGTAMGYVIRALPAGRRLYLEVCDKEVTLAYYAYNTPPNRDPVTAGAHLGTAAHRMLESGAHGRSFLRHATERQLEGTLHAAGGAPDRDLQDHGRSGQLFFRPRRHAQGQLTKAFNDILQAST